MSDPTAKRHGKRSSRVVAVVVALLAGAALAVWLPWERSVDAAEAPLAVASRGSVPAPAAPAVEPVARARLASGQTLELRAAELASGEPVALRLDVAQTPPGPVSLPVRVLATDGRVLEIWGTLRDPDRRNASVEIEADFLAPPGRYIVELRTTEKSHMPLRRYAIEVR